MILVKLQDNRLNPKSIMKHNVMIFILLTFLLIGIPLIINELYKMDCGYKTVWDAADVLAYYSVILSGIISICALYVTIIFTRKDTEKQIKATQAQYNVPFFLMDSVCQMGESIYTSTKQNENHLPWNREIYIRHNADDRKNINLRLNNIGEGTAIGIVYTIDAFPEVLCCAEKYVKEGHILELEYDFYHILSAKFGARLLPQKDEMFDVDITLYYQNTSGVMYSQYISIRHECRIKSNVVALTINEISPQRIEQSFSIFA